MLISSTSGLAPR